MLADHLQNTKKNMRPFYKNEQGKAGFQYNIAPGARDDLSERTNYFAIRRL